MQWIKNNYEQLYEQVKAGKRVVCWILLKHTSGGRKSKHISVCDKRGQFIDWWCFGHTFLTEDATDVTAFIGWCEYLHVEWLDESEPAPSPDLEAEAAKLYPYTDRKDQGAFEYNWSQDDLRKGYITAARRYASQVEGLKGENERLREALQKIANWELPPSGKYWDLLETEPMSYEAAYGSNGVRDYIKSIAANALKPKEEQ